MAPQATSQNRGSAKKTSLLGAGVRGMYSKGLLQSTATLFCAQTRQKQAEDVLVNLDRTDLRLVS